MRGTDRGEAVRSTRGPALVAAAALLLAGCLIPPDREAIALGGDLYGAFADGTRLGIEVPTCGGEPEVTVLEEADDEVRVEVFSERQRGDGDACLDSVQVELSRPLDGRDLVDLTSGRTLRVEER